ncbi:MAG: hypothetical protein ABJH04_07960 [Cyclobacteriaceae bacterium]
MEITLKRLAIFERMSEETTAFSADIYADGKKVGYAKNDGRGGETLCNPFTETLEAFKMASNYADSLPPVKSEFNGNTFEFKSSIESIVDDIVDKEVQSREAKKFQKKMEKAMIDGFVVGVRGSNSFSVYKFKKGVNIASLPKNVLQRMIQEMDFNLKEGEEILNTNL